MRPHRRPLPIGGRLLLKLEKQLKDAREIKRSKRHSSLISSKCLFSLDGLNGMCLMFDQNVSYSSLNFTISKKIPPFA
jgi:hypothetical protein